MADTWDNVQVATSFTLFGLYTSHNGWITSIAANADTVLTASRDKTILSWDITNEPAVYTTYNAPKTTLKGHGHFVSDVEISADGKSAVSSSWDGMIRLWDLSTGTTTRRFVGHTADVVSVSFSPDGAKFVSGSRDKTMKLWNTLGGCEQTFGGAEGHNDWVTCVDYNPNALTPLAASCGWDGYIKLWDLATGKLKRDYKDPNGRLNSLVISPDGSLIAAGGKSGKINIWDLERGAILQTYDVGATVHDINFSPTRYWMCAATSAGIKIWNLETKEVVAHLTKDDLGNTNRTRDPMCTTVAWNPEGTALFAGYTDGLVRRFNLIDEMEDETRGNILESSQYIQNLK